MIFESHKLIRFAHCDPAGIVFYPRYAELCNEVVEDWFREGLGVDFHEFHEERRLGFPTVRLEMEFLTPSRYGDVLAFRLGIARLGKSSMELSIEACRGEQIRLRIKLKTVLVSLDTLRPRVIDDFWRKTLLPYVQGGEAA
ncbi:thioesterase family protein [Dechloromonas agitata]|uniref:acyl-CoA thioesterase n=1 Tax=Dechloromonas agitata TaxID=73030 RepID=UPI00237DABE0|nr:thioesterase family protein [Dechloromonas agitata]MDE1544048.1 thioesterase family protein [Dechloromonas agitata]